jgi:magnesium transporter
VSLLPRRRHKRDGYHPGASPGTLIRRPDAHPTHIRAMAYGASGLEEVEVTDLRALPALRERHRVLWVDVTGLADVDRIQALGAMFDLHALSLEDVLNGHQRVKMDRHPDHLFIVVYMAENDEDLGVDQLNLFVGKDFVITMRDAWDAPFVPIRARVANSDGHMRRAGADYLAYAILDTVVDHYFPVLDILSDRLESLEDEVLVRPSTELVSRIQRVRRDLMALRRAMWPLRDVINEVFRGGPGNPFTEETQVFMRDLQDHVLRVVELGESYREIVSSLMDLYLSSLSNRMNEVMKVLTIIATIFIPLSFIAGVYGMNFDASASPWNMPETKWRYGYPFAMGLMAVVGLALLGYFRHKGWIGPPPRDRDGSSG